MPKLPSALPLIVWRAASRFLFLTVVAGGAGAAQASDARELAAFLWRVLPLALVISLAAAWHAGATTRHGRGERAAGALVLGLLFGVLWAGFLVGAHGLGGPLAGASGLLLAVAAAAITPPLALFAEGAAHPGRAAGGAVGLALLVALLTPWLVRPVTRAMSRDRELTVTAFELLPGSGLLRPDAAGQGEILGPEIALLRASGITGSLRFRAKTVVGEGAPARIVLVVRGPVPRAVTLAEPASGGALYLQDGETWRELAGASASPGRALSVLNRDSDRATAREGRPASLEVWIEEEGGARSSMRLDLGR